VQNDIDVIPRSRPAVRPASVRSGPTTGWERSGSRWCRAVGRPRGTPDRDGSSARLDP